MTTRTRRLVITSLLVLVGALGPLGYTISRARAAGIPSPQALTYTGTLANSTGERLNGSFNIQLQLWDVEKDGGTPVCLTQSAATQVTAGVFTVALPTECSTAVRANPNLWVEVLVAGASLGRAKIGAVPYAMEADRAVSASQATNFQVTGSLTVGTATTTLKGPMIRKVARAHGLGPGSDVDTGNIEGRTLTFTKMQADTGVRITWMDNLRVTKQGTACSWEIQIDGKSCATPGALQYDIYDGNVSGINHHRPAAVVGTCFGLSVGSHTIQIVVGPVSGTGQGDCATGWPSHYWSIEAEEVY